MLASLTIGDMFPFVTLSIGIFVVIGGIVFLRVNAFLALLAAAVSVVILSPGAWADKITRVTESFGSTAAGVGVVIALAAIIGKAMTESGAADRIVQFFLAVLGEDRAASAFLASGFVLAIPVFFDTVFYLLVPLARGMYRRTGKNYLKYLLAIACSASAHALVPPTPGPLLVAAEFGVDLGTMIFVGILVALPAALVGLVFAVWADRRWPDLKPLEEPAAQTTATATTTTGDWPVKTLPGIWVSVAPIIVPVVLITSNSFLASFWQESADSSVWQRQILDFMQFVGNANFALLLSAAIALGTMWFFCRPSKESFSASIESALMSGGVIVLITCAGGAFGGALKGSGVREAIELAAGDSAASGIGLLLLSFLVASLIKFAQGSSTAAMIVTSGMISAMITPDDPLGAPMSIGFNPVYLATAIGAGSLVGSWMNDSGFWIYAKMGGVSESLSLKTWSLLLATMGVVAMIMTLVLAVGMPMEALPSPAEVVSFQPITGINQ
jgi:GntP family gluconate:H+ symporter